MTLAIKIAIVITLLAIVASLLFGAVFLVRDSSDSRRVVRTLTLRISLSVALFVLVIMLFLSGTLEPNTPFSG